ncbi:MAG: hypothetical protein OES57_00210 [Acidimicrobiia bacterium]|nr:hypothetical protein [Acidimicrobiia bacterium]
MSHQRIMFPTNSLLESRRSGDVCGVCGHRFADDETRHATIFRDADRFRFVACWRCAGYESEAESQARVQIFRDDDHDHVMSKCDGCDRLLDGWVMTAKQTEPISVFGFAMRNETDVCSRRCYDRVWYRLNRSPNRGAGKRRRKQCASCETDFIPQRNDARYCSVACRVAAHRARKVLGP